MVKKLLHCSFHILIFQGTEHYRSKIKKHVICQDMERSSTKIEKLFIFLEMEFSSIIFFYISRRNFRARKILYGGNFLSSKNQKTPTLKKFPIFLEIEISSLKLKKSLISEEERQKSEKQKTFALKKCLVSYDRSLYANMGGYSYIRVGFKELYSEKQPLQENTQNYV